MVSRSFSVAATTALLCCVPTTTDAFTLEFRSNNQPRLLSLYSTTEDSVDVDVSIPYDAAARLAYEASGSHDHEYDAFKAQFEASAIADVISKHSKRNEHNIAVLLPEEGGKEALNTHTGPDNEHIERSNDSTADDTEMIDENETIAQLHEKLHHWKQELKLKKEEYLSYIRKVGLSGKVPPIYERKGKIDHYRPRPVYDKETERIQGEISDIKEHIIWTQAKINEERRLEQALQEASGGVDTTQFEDEINRLQQQLDSLKDERDQLSKESNEKDHKLEDREQKIEMWVKTLEDANQKLDQLQTRSDEKSKLLQEKESEINTLNLNLEWAKTKQEEILQKADGDIRALHKEYTTTIESMKEDFASQLSEKKEQIDNLNKEIQGLVLHLQEKRKEINVKGSIMATLESILGEKEEVLDALIEERDSLKSMGKQSWKVLRTRFKKRVLRRKDIQPETYDTIKAEKTTSHDSTTTATADENVVAKYDDDNNEISTKTEDQVLMTSSE